MRRFLQVCSGAVGALLPRQEAKPAPIVEARGRPEFTEDSAPESPHAPGQEPKLQDAKKPSWKEAGLRVDTRHAGSSCKS